MKLWYLKPIRMWKPPWDKINSAVVCAMNESDAREITSEHADSEGPAPWLDKKITSCVELVPDKERIVVIDYNQA